MYADIDLVNTLLSVSIRKRIPNSLHLVRKDNNINLKSSFKALLILLPRYSVI